MTGTMKPHLELNKQSHLLKSQSATNLNFNEKLTEASETNAKLKELLQTIKKNAVHKKKQSQQQTDKSTELQITKSKKRQGKLISEIEQLTNNLNVLINENYKLKLQVDSSRNSRVIYSNVYKTLEKEIRKNEYLYKMAIIEGLAYEEIEGKVNEKVEKVVRKLEKEINQMQGVLVRKKQKNKSRLDTGLSTLRGVKGGSKQTNRCSSKDDTTNRVGQTKRDEVICESNVVRKQAIGKSSRKMSVAKHKQQAESQAIRTEKSTRTRNKIPLAEDINEYFNLEMKSNYYDNVAMQLAKICGDNSLEQIRNAWKNVENDIQAEFRDYMAAEEKIKAIQREIDELDKESTLQTKQELGEKSEEEKDLQEAEQQIRMQQQKLNELEESLSKKMDFNCSKLTNDEISHHVLRMNNQNQISARQLQKLLESICKEKTSSLRCSRLSQTLK